MNAAVLPADTSALESLEPVAPPRGIGAFLADKVLVMAVTVSWKSSSAAAWSLWVR